MEAEPGREFVLPSRVQDEGAAALTEFAAMHGPALRSSGVPERYWGSLLHKLEHEVRGPGVRAVGARSAGRRGRRDGRGELETRRAGGSDPASSAAQQQAGVWGERVTARALSQRLDPPGSGLGTESEMNELLLVSGAHYS